MQPMLQNEQYQTSSDRWMWTVAASTLKACITCQALRAAEEEAALKQKEQEVGEEAARQRRRLIKQQSPAGAASCRLHILN
jgi:hypothetical protein